MLTRDGCEARLGRLRSLLAEANLDAAVVSDPRELYYFLGLPLPPAGEFPAVAWVEAAGRVATICHQGTEPLLGDCVATYPWHVGYTRNLDNQRAAAGLLKEALAAGRPRRVGYQADHLAHSVAAVVGATGAELVPLDEAIYAMQRAKDPDELACLHRSIRADLSAYEAVGDLVAPGVNELEVLAAGARGAALYVGEPVWHGGDYQCASLGGPARDRECLAGELYIIDAWCIYRGYWSDLCRTYSMGAPTELQQSVYDHLAEILLEVPQRLRPGGSGTELARWMDARIREHPHLADTGLTHHAGHGVGLRAHTEPDLNLDREGILQVGDTVSVEPGAYSAELNAGVRVENHFVITETGCELLSEYPLTLMT